MKQKRAGTFMSGMLAGAVLSGCITAGLALGGTVAFGTMGLKTVNGKTVVEPGDTIINASGCEIPAAIVYTDEAGGDNTYVHIRTVGKALDIPVYWQDNMVYLGKEPFNPSDVPIGRPPANQPTSLSAAGSKAAHYIEVEPYWPMGDKITGTYADETRMVSYGAYGTLTSPQNGEYLSLSITNNTESDMYLVMRCPDPFYSNIEHFPSTRVPAGETVVRTFQAGEYTGYLYPRAIEYNVYYMSSGLEPVSKEKTDVTISAVSFERQS